MLQIVAPLTDNSRGVIYDCNIFMIQVTGLENTKLSKEAVFSVVCNPSMNELWAT